MIFVELSVQNREAQGEFRNDIERKLLDVVNRLVGELHPQRAKLHDVRLASRLDRDLGIDSLGRAELILRIERAFRARLPVEVVGEAETVRDLLEAVGHAAPRSTAAPSIAPEALDLSPVAAASDARTLLDVLDSHVDEHADRPHVTVLEDDANVLAAMTYGELARGARSAAAGLIERDVVPGDRVALMLPTSPDFFTAFYGILYAGAVPVPIYPPMRMAQIEEHFRRQAGILRNAGARLLVTVPEGQRLAALLRAQVETLTAVESVESIKTEPADLQFPTPPDENATALIQYTSGSTGDPKGVVLTHANLLANIRAMGTAMEGSSEDVFVSWLPLYHDMGLIGAWLGCLHFAAPLYVMSPLAFLVRPDSWLWAIHRYRATLSAAPNFGFEMCLNKIDDADIEGLDLSSLRMVANGAEPVSVHTLGRFIERFERYGFKPGAMAPVYGLAENAVGVAFPPPGREPIIDRLDRDALMTRGKAEPAKPGDAKPLEIVSCGKPLPDHEVRIVDQSGRDLGEREEGRLEFRGPSATSGYYRDEAKTRDLIHEGWLDSGDRAYMADGEVYITGRIKDVIIRAGRNIHPQDLEEAISGITGIRKGGVAVFGTADPTSATERIIVLAETRATDPAEQESLRKHVHETASDVLGAPADDVVLAPPRTVPKTSSGKIRRSTAKELYEQGRIGTRKPALWWQILRLSLSGIRPQLAVIRRHAGAFLYAGWWWTVVGLGFGLGWAAIMVLPRLAWRWSAVRGIAQVSLAAIGAKLANACIERVPRGNAVLAFNHASYMDPPILVATLPGEPVFVAKRELAGQVFAGPLLRRLGVAFVERFDISGGLADVEAVTSLARQGRLIVVFPEGTFTRRTGLAGFHLGAFKIASEANLPVFPGIIHGARKMLRADQWFPQWSPIEVEIAEAVKPSGTDLASVVRLRDEVRAAIAARSREPDLGDLTEIAPPQ